MKDCSQCGKSVAKYHRIYKGEGYCHTCYVRVFKLLPCTKCSETHRLHYKEEKAICETCRNNKPCVRCGKEEYEIGKITAYGPICNSCSPYFREKKPCSHCRVLSSKLTKTEKNGTGLSICPKCYRQEKGYETCPQCHKNRLLIETEYGKMCKKCHEIGLIDCQTCGIQMPAGMGSTCDSCGWLKRFNQRAHLLKFTIPAEQVRADFIGFSQWLLQDIGSMKAALTIELYAPFFIEITKFWNELPSYEVILNHFKPKGLRKYLKVKQWLYILYQGNIQDSKKTDLAEVGRIDALFAKIADQPIACKLLQGYRAELMARLYAGRTTLKSVRLALQPAVGLLLKSNELPTQSKVGQYLAERLGQRAALTGFINYLNREYDLKLVCKYGEKEKIQVQQRKRKKMENEMIAFVIKSRKEPSSFHIIDWIRLSMQYFHRCSYRTSSKFEVNQDQCIVFQDGKKYPLPSIFTI
ncbi:hypothetical protein [Acinetobacter bereziniae]|uniref:hypothetical protein n=1 Tax=Acinetobacter bereziniae TaxID=106648 RepID=UPI00300A68DA